jgi:hypothetical protein
MPILDVALIAFALVLAIYAFRGYRKERQLNLSERIALLTCVISIIFSRTTSDSPK